MSKVDEVEQQHRDLLPRMFQQAQEGDVISHLLASILIWGCK